MAKQKKGRIKKGRIKKKKITVPPEGRVYISTSFNNIIITFTDKAGNTISWSSAGKVGFRGSKKNTPYAAQIAAKDAAKDAYEDPEQEEKPLSELLQAWILKS